MSSKRYSSKSVYRARLSLGFIILLLSLMLGGCQSPKAKIDRSAQRITALAQSTVENIDAAIGTGEVGPAALPHLEHSKANQDQIVSEADIARLSLHGVQDITPWWGYALGNFAIAAVLVAIVLLLWQSGLGHVIKQICYAAGLFIPRATRASAALDADAIVRRRACSEQREAIAARRSADAAYDVEFIRQKRRSQLETRLFLGAPAGNMEVVT